MPRKFTKRRARTSSRTRRAPKRRPAAKPAVTTAAALLDGRADAGPHQYAHIYALIDAHLDDALPDRWRGVKCEGHDVSALDAHATACMLVFQQGPERFGWKGCWHLQECHLALCEVVESPRTLALGGPGPYLERARTITGLILEDRCAALAKRRRKRRWWQAA